MNWIQTILPKHVCLWSQCIFVHRLSSAQKMCWAKTIFNAFCSYDTIFYKSTYYIHSLIHTDPVSTIPSKLLSFLLYCCHSFQIIVIPSELLPFQIFVILNSSRYPPKPKGKKIGRQSRPYLRVHHKHCKYIYYFLRSSLKK